MEADELQEAVQVMGDMMRYWEVGDTPLFKKEAAQLTLVANKGMYEIGDTVANGGFDARDVHHAQYVDNRGGDFQLDLMSGRQYLDFPYKDNTGTPTQYWFDRSPSSYLPSEPATDTSPQAAKLYVWPKPDAAAVAANAVINLRISCPFAIPTALGDSLDVPEAWYKPVAYCLAAELYTEYKGNDVRAEAAEMWENVLDDYRPAFVDFENEHGR